MGWWKRLAEKASVASRSNEGMMMFTNPNRSTISLSKYSFFVVLALSLPVNLLAAQIPAEPEGYVDCPLCADPTHVPQNEFSVFSSGSYVLTCEKAYEMGQTLRLPEENCTFWQDRGATICDCAAEPTVENECPLCEDGSSLPIPRLEGAPDRVCAQLEVDAKRDDPEKCLIWQQTYGVYCGCDNPQATAPGREVCRICGGDNIMPNSAHPVSLLTDEMVQIDSSCGELEFEANLPDKLCDDYQLLYAMECCPESIPIVDDGNEDKDNALHGPKTTQISVMVPLFFIPMFVL